MKSGLAAVEDPVKARCRGCKGFASTRYACRRCGSDDHLLHTHELLMSHTSVATWWHKHPYTLIDHVHETGQKGRHEHPWP